jgi:hypothetical protein
MKTYNVATSTEREPKTEVMYAYNGQFGIETTHSEEEASCFDEAVKLEVKVSLMFPGTTEEWNNYIDECVIETLKKEGITYTNDYGTFLNN